MANPLTNILQGGNLNPQTNNLNPQMNNYNPQTQTETLPYGGGTFNPSGGAQIKPVPVFSGAPNPNPQETVAVANASEDLYAKYRDPKTGRILTPEEYAVNLANKVPKGTGQITNYAGDAMTNPNQTSEELTSRATNLNNARNDIAVGESDPYGVGNKSGIAYSPTELKAIENAYAGIYDPALNDVFSRLRDKKAEEAKAAAREDRIFATNEAIRQWRATTGTKKSGSDSGSGYNGVDTEYTDTQIRDGAGIAGMSIEAFAGLDDEVKNVYSNPRMVYVDQVDDPVLSYLRLPKNFDPATTTFPMYQVFDAYADAVSGGDIHPEDMANLIDDSGLPEAVQKYYKALIPAAPEKTEEEPNRNIIGNIISGRGWYFGQNPGKG